MARDRLIRRILLSAAVMVGSFLGISHAANPSFYGPPSFSTNTGLAVMWLAGQFEIHRSTKDATTLVTIGSTDGIRATYGITVGTMNGAGLTTCSGANQALTWANGLFGCQGITGTGGGGATAGKIFTGTSMVAFSTIAPTGATITSDGNGISTITWTPQILSTYTAFTNFTSTAQAVGISTRNIQAFMTTAFSTMSPVISGLNVATQTILADYRAQFSTTGAQFVGIKDSTRALASELSVFRTTSDVILDGKMPNSIGVIRSTHIAPNLVLSGGLTVSSMTAIALIATSSNVVINSTANYNIPLIVSRGFDRTGGAMLPSAPSNTTLLVEGSTATGTGGIGAIVVKNPQDGSELMLEAFGSGLIETNNVGLDLLPGNGAVLVHLDTGAENSANNPWVNIKGLDARLGISAGSGSAKKRPSSTLEVEGGSITNSGNGNGIYITGVGSVSASGLELRLSSIGVQNYTLVFSSALQATVGKHLIITQINGSNYLIGAGDDAVGAGSSSGGSDNLGSHLATQPVAAPFGINTSSVVAIGTATAYGGFYSTGNFLFGGGTVTTIAIDALGTVANPSLLFEGIGSGKNSGFYGNSITLSPSVNGVESASFIQTGLTMPTNQIILGLSGTMGAPGLGYQADQAAGIVCFGAAPTRCALTTGGGDRIRWNQSGEIVIGKQNFQGFTLYVASNSAANDGLLMVASGVVTNPKFQVDGATTSIFNFLKISSFTTITSSLSVTQLINAGSSLTVADVITSGVGLIVPTSTMDYLTVSSGANFGNLTGGGVNSTATWNFNGSDFPLGSIMNLSNNGPSTNLLIYSFGTAPIPNLSGRSARGTRAAPTVLMQDDALMRFGGGGHTGISMGSNSALEEFAAAENFSNTNRGAYIRFATAANGTTTLVNRMKIADNGNVGIGTTTASYLFQVHEGSMSVTGSKSGIVVSTVIAAQAILGSVVPAHGDLLYMATTYLLAVTTDSGHVGFGVSTNSYVMAASSTAIHTLSSCGASPTIRGGGSVFTVTPGAAASGCTITFNPPFAQPPHPFCYPLTGSVVNTFTVTPPSNTTLTVSETGIGTFTCILFGQN